MERVAVEAVVRSVETQYHVGRVLEATRIDEGRNDVVRVLASSGSYAAKIYATTGYDMVDAEPLEDVN